MFHNNKKKELEREKIILTLLDMFSKEYGNYGSP